MVYVVSVDEDVVLAPHYSEHDGLWLRPQARAPALLLVWPSCLPGPARGDYGCGTYGDSNAFALPRRSRGTISCPWQACM